MIATALIAIALIPALDALYTGALGGAVLRSSSDEHYAVLAMMEEVLAEPYATLTSAAAAAGGPSIPSSYSDVSGSQDRRLVFVALYDGDPFEYTSHCIGTVIDGEVVSEVTR